MDDYSEGYEAGMRSLASALRAMRADRDGLRARVADVIARHETQADEYRKLADDPAWSTAIRGERRVLADVHYEAAAWLRAALDGEGE